MSFTRTSLLILAATALFAGLSGSYIVPLDHTAIEYTKRPVDDPISRLQKRINTGEVKLTYDQDFGYLPSVLKALGLKKESQILVFSKTSFQAPRIAPRLPRALYFGDDVSTGYVRGGDVLEFAAVDPKQGVIFYTLDQEPTTKPKFDRQDTCLQCHATGGTLGVPGLVVRSVFPDTSGMPQFQGGSFISDHRSPLKERWGGWYVSGAHGTTQKHMGNALIRDKEKPTDLDTENTQNQQSLQGKFDTGAYLSPHSDIVALMTFEHQTRMTNLITRVGYEARMALSDNAAMNEAFGRPKSEWSDSTRRRIHSPVEELLDYLLFVEEAPLTEPIKGVSGFTEEFSKQGPRDPKGRSLRDLDLNTRLLRYRCSFLIYSEAFDGMPQEVKDRLYQRLWQVLTGEDQDKRFAAISQEERTAVREILIATKKNIPTYWR